MTNATTITEYTKASRLIALLRAMSRPSATFFPGGIGNDSQSNSCSELVLKVSGFDGKEIGLSFMATRSLALQELKSIIRHAFTATEQLDQVYARDREPTIANSKRSAHQRKAIWEMKQMLGRFKDWPVRECFSDSH